jgi:hypothetical protein
METTIGREGSEDDLVIHNTSDLPKAKADGIMVTRSVNVSSVEDGNK